MKSTAVNICSYRSSYSSPGLWEATNAPLSTGLTCCCRCHLSYSEPIAPPCGEPAACQLRVGDFTNEFSSHLNFLQSAVCRPRVVLRSCGDRILNRKPLLSNRRCRNLCPPHYITYFHTDI